LSWRARSRAWCCRESRAIATDGLTVAVTGPTGDIGRAFLRACDRSRAVGRVLGMARRPFDPSSLGLRKTEYRRGDVLDRDAVDALAADADVVVHLAYIIMGGREESRRINLEGSANVFAAAASAPRVKRLVYTSSVAAYGFHADNPRPLTEAVPPRGSDEHYYSAEKAELELTLWRTIGDVLDTYVFRPCIVAGPDALMPVESIPGVVRRLPLTVLPDTGMPFQLVHHDDVASALVAAVRGVGAPGIYNLAGPGELTPRDLAGALGWHSVPFPGLAVSLAALATRLPLVPAQAQWLNAFRVPMVMSTAKARRELRWRPRHSAAETLAATVASARSRGVL
jgi:UDP-glucose 4-epimerase